MSKEEQKAKRREYQKRYYYKHQEKIAERRKSHNINQEAKKASGLKHYESHLDERKTKMMARYWRQKKLVDAIAIHYGCQNHNCRWQGDFVPCQLDFHHLDKTTKTKVIGHLYNAKLSKIATEINKCVVLCRCCHPLLHSGCELGITGDNLCTVDNFLQISEKSPKS